MFGLLGGLAMAGGVVESALKESNKKHNKKKNSTEPLEKSVKVTENEIVTSERIDIKTEPTVTIEEQVKWIELALRYLANELPYAFPPKVNEKPIVTISNGNKTVAIRFIPQNQLYAAANVTFDYNTKERIAVFATTVALEKVGIIIAGQELTEKSPTENADTNELTGNNFENLKYRSMHECDPEATYMLGLIYEKGLLDKDKDHNKACEYYQRAAKWGCEKAKSKLYELLKSGNVK